MAKKIELLFGLNLANYDYHWGLAPGNSRGVHGPRFTRWLPDGRVDAIRVPQAHVENQMEIWFERRGHVQDGFIVFDKDKCEVDKEIMRKQLALEAGHLRGQATYALVLDGELDAVRGNLHDTAPYFDLAKRIAKFLFDPIKAFVDILRTQYGQYWLPELRAFDSRVGNIGHYCRQFFLKWREDEREEWKPFSPTTEIEVIDLVVHFSEDRFQEYLTQADWRELQKSFDPKQPVPHAFSALLRALELDEEGDTPEAFILAATGLELAVEQFIVDRLEVSTMIKTVAQQFFDMTIRPKFAVLAPLTGKLDSAIIDEALKGIEIRNKIIHEGKTPSKDYRKSLDAIFQAAAAFLGLDRWKRPRLNIGNGISPGGASQE